MRLRHFRLLIIIHVLLLAAGTAAPLAPPGYSPTLAEAFEAEPVPMLLDSSWLMPALMLPFVAAVLAGLYGLYMLKRWGRALSLYSSVAGCALTVFLGPSLQSGWESALFEAATLLWGAILALSYYSPLRRQFGTR